MNFFERLQKETVAEREALYHVPQIVDGMHGRITRDTYIAYLEQAYHHVKHTLPLLMAAGAVALPNISRKKSGMRNGF